MKAIKSWVTIKVNMANKCTEFVSIFSFRHFILKTSYDWFLLRLFSVFHFTKLNQCHAHRKYIKNMTSRNFLWLNSLLEIQLFKCTCTRDFFRYFNFDAKKSCVTQRRIVWCCSVLIWMQKHVNGMTPFDLAMHGGKLVPIYISEWYLDFGTLELGEVSFTQQFWAFLYKWFWVWRCKCLSVVDCNYKYDCCLPR